MRIQIIKAVIARRGHHKITTRVSDHAFDIALVIASRWPTKLVIKQVMRLQLCEPPCPNAGAITQNTRHSDLGIVLENRLRDAAKERKGSHMAITKRLGRLRRIPLHKHCIRMR